MLKRYRSFLTPLVTVGFILGAFFLLRHSLKNVHVQEMWREVHNFPASRIALAMALTFVSHTALTLYDYIGVRYIRAKVAYWRVAWAAFTAYSISHTLGFPSVTGGTVRYRLYSRWGCNAVDVAAIITMAGVTLFLGMFLIGGFALLFDGARVQSWTDLPAAGINALGVACLVLVTGYASIGLIRQRPLRIWRFVIAIPRPRFTFVQLLVSGIDWLVVASVLYVLLPDNPVFTFLTFLGVFVLAYLLGTLSNVPGGLGVFEAVIFKTLAASVKPEAILSTLVVYRAVYHLLPFILGGIVFLLSEATRPAALRARGRSQEDIDRNGCGCLPLADGSPLAHREQRRP